MFARFSTALDQYAIEHNIESNFRFENERMRSFNRWLYIEWNLRVTSMLAVRNADFKPQLKAKASHLYLKQSSLEKFIHSDNTKTNKKETKIKRRNRQHVIDNAHT